MERIRSYFEQIVEINESDWQQFASKLKKATYPKKSILLKAGKIENYLSFVEKGSLRFYIPKTGNDLTFGFCFEGEFVSAYDSFLTRAPSTYHVETLSDTELWRLTYNDLQVIYRTTEIGNMIGRSISERLFLIKSKREQSFLNDMAEKRYQCLFTERPNLIKEIPLKYIASYIGVTPQALSRIRRRIS